MANAFNDQSQRVQAVWKEASAIYALTEREEAKYLWRAHVQVVAGFASELADRFGGKKDLAVVGALLHDIADVWLEREDPAFEPRTRGAIQGVLKENGFTFEEVAFVEDEVIEPHSCYPGHLPETVEGKILATADAMAHLSTNFYSEIYPIFFSAKKSKSEFSAWVLKKLDRDFHDKIFFVEVRTSMKPKYDELVKKFSE